MYTCLRCSQKHIHKCPGAPPLPSRRCCGVGAKRRVTPTTCYRPCGALLAPVQPSCSALLLRCVRLCVDVQIACVRSMCGSHGLLCDTRTRVCVYVCVCVCARACICMHAHPTLTCGFDGRRSSAEQAPWAVPVAWWRWNSRWPRQSSSASSRPRCAKSNENCDGGVLASLATSKSNVLGSRCFGIHLLRL